MKLTELMIGDWVQYTYTPYGQNEPRTMVFQVSQIECFSRRGEYFVWGVKEGRVCRVEDLQPIPLTAEILDKNGFDCSDKEVAQLYFKDGDYRGHFSLRAMYDKKSGEQRGWSFFAFSVLTILDNVHELQNALRLCGIEKEIVL